MQETWRLGDDSGMDTGENQSGSRVTSRVETTIGGSDGLRKRCAWEAAFAQETDRAKLSGRDKGQLKQEAETTSHPRPPTPEGCRKVCVLWEQESRNVFEKSLKEGKCEVDQN